MQFVDQYKINLFISEGYLYLATKFAKNARIARTKWRHEHFYSACAFFIRTNTGPNMQTQQINQLAEKIESLLPPGLKQVKEDFDNKLKKLLQQQLSKMDFVSREEFDIQSKVLARTREKLEQLEKRIEQLGQK